MPHVMRSVVLPPGVDAEVGTRVRYGSTPYDVGVARSREVREDGRVVLGVEPLPESQVLIERLNRKLNRRG